MESKQNYDPFVVRSCQREGVPCNGQEQVSVAQALAGAGNSQRAGYAVLPFNGIPRFEGGRGTVRGIDRLPG